MSKLDPNVEAVRAKLKQRAEFGLKKYNVDTTREDLTDLEWLNHLQEELMDSTVYVERIMHNMKNTRNNRINSCAQYIDNRIALGEEPSEDNLAMWMHDHFDESE